MKGFAMSDFVCQSPASLFSLSFGIHHSVFTTQGLLGNRGLHLQNKQHVTLSVLLPSCQLPFLLVAMTAWGKLLKPNIAPAQIHMRAQQMRVGGMCVFHYKDCKTVSPRCRRCCCCCSAQGLFQVQADCRAADNPTVNMTDSMDLTYCLAGPWLLVLCLCPSFLSLSLSLSLSLCNDSYMPLYAQTQTDSWLDDFWRCRESASAHTSSIVVWAQQVLATSLLLSSVLLVLECTVLQTQLKKKTHEYIIKLLSFVWQQCLSYLSSWICPFIKFLCFVQLFLL